jgi:death on curing protein
MIYNKVIEQGDGSKGMRDIRLLESAVARPHATFDGRDLYPGIFSKVAALGYSIINNHPFIDGNKRVGYMCMRVFLNINGYDIEASLDEKYKFVIEIAENVMDEKTMAKWLKEHIA